LVDACTLIDPVLWTAQASCGRGRCG
jgi:hypothetical protein